MLVMFGGIPSGEDDPGEAFLSAPKSLNILAILPLSGDDIDLGLAQQYGIRRGTIQPRDHPVNLYIEDSQGDPEHAVAILRERSKTHTLHAIIISGSDCAESIAPYAEELGIPMATIAAPLQPGIEVSRNRISFTPPIGAEIDAIAPFLSEYSDVAFIYPDCAEGREMAAQIQTILSGKSIRLIEYTQESEDYTELIHPLRITPPEIFIIHGDTQVPAIVSAIRSRGANPVILIWERGSMHLLEEKPDLSEGVFVLAPGINPDHPVFSGISNQTSLFAPGIVAESFDSAHSLSSSITTCEGDMECLAGWFWNRKYTGALGTIQFNEKREASYHFEIRQIRRGEAETVGIITAPRTIVYIHVITGSTDDWFVDEVKKGIEAAFTVINEQTGIEIPLAIDNGIPSLFDARLGAIYDLGDVPEGTQIIGTLTITPDGKTSISGGDTDRERSIGVDNEAYIRYCFDYIDEQLNGGENKTPVSLLSGVPDDPLIGMVRTTAESHGYKVETDITYEDIKEIGSAIDVIMTGSPDTPLFVSVRSPGEAGAILLSAREAGYSPAIIFTLGDAWKTESFIRRAGVFSDGIIAASMYQRESTTKSLAIRNVNSLMVRKSGQEINDISARAFTGVIMIADGTNRADSIDRVSIDTAIQMALMTPEYGALYDGTTHMVQMINGVYRTIL